MAAVTDAGPSIRIATKLAHTYESAQQTAQALAVYERLIAAFPSNHNAIDFYKKARDLAATLGDEKKSKSFQARIDQWLAQKKPAAK
jgi:hypothetical protein